tara:strand:- start:756 stop:1418 length:663 start_codon:yes stop_codon:yes gene_type:complete
MPFKKVGKNKNVSPSGRVFTDKQVKLYYATDGFKNMDEEEMKPIKKDINPKMKKKDLVEYIKSKKIVNEQDNNQYNFPHLNEITGQERRDIMKYFEMLRQSGIINMFGSHALLNWNRDDLHRFLYGERNDPEAIEREIEEEDYDNEDGENDNTISLLEDKLEKINYLLDNKQKIRDVLIRAALNRIENTNGNHEMENVQRVFQKMAKEAWHFWVGIQNIN